MNDKILLHQQNSITFVSRGDIIFCQSDNCYLSLHLNDGRKILIVKSLSKFQSQLSSNFIRVSQSYVVNMAFIKSIDKKRRIILLSGSHEIPFTMTIKELLNEYIKISNVLAKQAV